MRLFAVVNPNDHLHQTERDYRIYPLLIYLAILFDYQLITPHVNMGIGGVKPSFERKKKVPRFTRRTPLAEDEGFKPPIPGKGIPDFESSAFGHSANLPNQ